MTTVGLGRCGFCKRDLRAREDCIGEMLDGNPVDLDCGGDCWKCMHRIEWELQESAGECTCDPGPGGEHRDYCSRNHPNHACSELTCDYFGNANRWLFTPPADD